MLADIDSMSGKRPATLNVVRGPTNINPRIMARIPKLKKLSAICPREFANW